MSDLEVSLKLKASVEQFVASMKQAGTSFDTSLSGMDTTARTTGDKVSLAMAKVGIRNHSEIEAEIKAVSTAYKTLEDSGTLTARELAQANLKTSETIRDLKAQTNGWVESLAKMKGEILLAGASIYGIGTALGAAAKSSADFGKKMAEVSTLLDDTSGMANLTEQVRELTREYGGDVNKNAKALYDIISAGAANSADAIQILDVANKLAMGGVTDVSTAADGLTSAMNAYGLSAKDAASVSDAFFTAVKAGKTTVPELSASIGQVAPIANTAGVSLDQLLSSVAALTAGGTRTPEAITGIRSALTNIIQPSSQAAQLAKHLGIEFDAQALKAKGLKGFLDEVAKATGGNISQMSQLFGSVEGLNAVLTLTGTGAQKFGDTLAAMGDKAGQTETAVAKMMDTPATRAARFSAAMADIQISLGDAVTSFSPLLDSLTTLLNHFNRLDPATRTTIAGVTALAVAIVPLSLAAKSLGTAFGIVRTAMVMYTASTAANVVAIGAQTAATAAFGVALKAVPFAAAIALITDVVLRYNELKQAQDALNQSTALAHESQSRLAAGLLDLSTRTGVTITSMAEFDAAVASGKLVADEATGSWVAASAAQGEMAATSKDASVQLKGLFDSIDPIKTAAEGFVAAAVKARTLADELQKIDPAATDAKAKIDALIAGINLADKTDLTALIQSIDLVHTTTSKLAADIEGRVITAIQKADASQFSGIVAGLEAARGQAATTSEALNKISADVLAESFKRLGIDAKEAMGAVTDKTTEAIAAVDGIENNLKSLGKTAQQIAPMMEQALGKAISTAKTQADIEALTAKMDELKKSGDLNADSTARLRDQLMLQSQAIYAAIPGNKSFTDSIDKMISSASGYAELAKLRMEIQQMGRDGALTKEQVDQRIGQLDKQSAALDKQNVRLKDNAGANREVGTSASDAAKGVGDMNVAMDANSSIAAMVAHKIDAALGSISALSKEAEAAARSMRTVSNDWRDWAAAVGAMDPNQFVSQDTALAGLNEQLKSFQAQAKSAGDQAKYLAEQAMFGPGIEWANLSEGLSKIYGFTKGLAEAKAAMAEFQIAQYGIERSAKDGTLSFDEQLRKLEQLKGQYSSLDKASLQQLQGQIDSVKNSLKSMSDAANQTLATLQSQLASAQGRLADQAAIDAQQKILDLQTKITDAKKAGNTQALTDLNHALTVQQQLNNLAIKQAKAQEDQAKATPHTTPPAPTTTADTSAQTQTVKTVRIDLGNGSGFDVPASQESAALAAIRQLASAKSVSSS
ncbi:MAG: phage tail tape measure protein [Halothiobacillus sp.]